MTSQFKNQFENDVTTTAMISAFSTDPFADRNTTLLDILNHFHFQANRQGQYCRSWSYLFIYILSMKITYMYLHGKICSRTNAKENIRLDGESNPGLLHHQSGALTALPLSYPGRYPRSIQPQGLVTTSLSSKNFDLPYTIMCILQCRGGPNNRS